MPPATVMDGGGSVTTGEAGRPAEAGANVPADASRPDVGPVPSDGGADADAEGPTTDLFVYEPFAYPSGSISSLAGGRGFAGPWSGNARAGGALDYPRGGLRLDVAGAAADVNGGTSSRPLDPAAFPASLRDTAGKIGADGKSLYLSLLMRASRLPGDGEFGGVQLFDGTSEVRFIGAPFYNPADPARRPNFGLDRPGLSTPVYTGVPVTALTLLLVRIDFGLASDGGLKEARMSLWADPSLGAIPVMGSPDLVLTGPDFRFDRLQTTGFAGVQIDELRIGETMTSVLPSTGAPTTIAFEPFDYPEGPLFGAAGGLGWKGPWTSPNDASSATTVAAAFDLTGVPLRGRASRRTEGGPPIQRLFETAGLPPELSDTPGKIGVAGKAFWLSFLAEAPAPGQDQFAGVQLFDGAYTDPALGLFVGAPYRSAGRPDEWGLDQPGQATPTYAGTPTTTRARLVVRVQLPAASSGTSETRLWLSPTAATEAALGSPAATMVGKDFRFDRLRIGGNYLGFAVDELRLGTTYLDVAPSVTP